jgi:hypothetical protein
MFVLFVGHFLKTASIPRPMTESTKHGLIGVVIFQTVKQPEQKFTPP